MGKVGLIQVTDYLKSSTNISCTDISYAYRSFCGNNWLKTTVDFWTISPSVSDTRRAVYSITPGGHLYERGAYNSEIYVRPSLFLKSNIALTGNGGSSSEDMFKIS